MPARSVCLVALSLSEAGPGRFGRQVSVIDIYHTIPYPCSCTVLQLGEDTIAKTGSAGACASAGLVYTAVKLSLRAHIVDSSPQCSWSKGEGFLLDFLRSGTAGEHGRMRQLVLAASTRQALCLVAHAHARAAWSGCTALLHAWAPLTPLAPHMTHSARRLSE